ncbi:WD repeat-containing protein 36-like [Corticium candelabrum]|uniref:WD repeat-containing protein 36-like n=1 Tax=Corticium candelabrum TaxID=121492 RepID=UPI002E258951|nr:WD repeat-containing protein 36-like [Corticium candelabrum]
MASQLFVPFRALGFISNHVPLAIHTTGAETFVSTAVGHTFHQHTCSKLKLIFVGSMEDQAIGCLASYGMHLITSIGSKMKLWNRGKEVREFLGHNSDVHLILPFGHHVISIDEVNEVKIFEIETAEVYSELNFDISTFRITAAMHPSTYLNKILFGSHQGSMQLWNIKTNQLIFTFKGWNSPVTSIVQAPAVDVVGVGLQDGGLVLHNLKYDEVIMKFQQDWGPVTTVTFRTDNIPVMASGSTSGNIALWDLERKRLLSTIYNAHHGTVSGMEFLQSQPLLVSNGADNSLNVWIFDQPDGSGRLLRSRNGHSAPPTLCKFYGSSRHLILTAGLDRSLRLLSIVSDHYSTELSQGSIVRKAQARDVRPEELKLLPITSFFAEDIHENDWDNVVTCHVGQSVACTWSLQNKCIGKHKLKPHYAPKSATATVAVISHCGNFVLIGYSSGHVETFNIQSGLNRGCFGNLKAHDGAVRGVSIDAVNQNVVTGSADNTLKFWNFRSKQNHCTILLNECVCQMVYHRESSMLAVALDDFTIHVVDTDTRRIVRTFTGHTNRILDMAYSPDSRWLISSSMDMTVRTWDLPAAKLLDCFLVESAATSVSMSEVGDFLATTHVDNLGVYLWSNRFMYSAISLRPLPPNYQPEMLAMPTTGEQQIGGQILSQPHGEIVDMLQLKFKTPDQLAEELVSLSELPRSRWHNLIHLDIIKHRNKPKEPPRVPEAAPFFLPTVPGLDFQFYKDTQSNTSTEEKVAASKQISLSQVRPKSNFEECLDSCSSSGDYSPLVAMLETMGPSAINTEIHMLGSEEGGDVKQLLSMIQFFKCQSVKRKDYEMVEAYLQVFLKIHGETIAKNADLRSEAKALLDLQKETWSRIQCLLNQSLCLASYIRSATV